MNKRDFLKRSGFGLVGLTLLPSFMIKENRIIEKRIRTAHIGVGGMGKADLEAIASHPSTKIVALCDVDDNFLMDAKALHPEARVFSDYRAMLREMEDQIDAVIVSTPDHTHAPASLLAMNMNKPVYCQKPLTHYVSEARAMSKLAKEKNLVTQMGIQVHSFYDYKLATLLIQSGIIGKVHTVHAWSPKNWGYDGPAPKDNDPIPEQLNWNLWLGTSAERLYKNDLYHPGNWRKIMDYGCGTLGDMGVHIFDTPYNALQLDVPLTIKTECRATTNFGYPEKNVVTYEFPQTPFTTETLKWIWYDGLGAPEDHEDLKLPHSEEGTKNQIISENKHHSIETKISLDPLLAEEGILPEQGAMFVGEKGRLLLPHFMQLPKKIVNGNYVDISSEIETLEKVHSLGTPIRNYESEGPKHYHEFIDACLGKTICSAPFSYASKLTETILLGVIAGRFPNKTLHWDSELAQFKEDEANQFLKGSYRDF